MKSSYSTAELAKMFDVNESTVKRWSNQGHIECIKTRGGHRRFPIRAVLRFAHAHRLVVSNIDGRLQEDGDLRANVLAGNVQCLVPDLKAAMAAGNVEEILAVMRLGFAAYPDLLHVYHELIFPPLAQLGDAWAKGELTIDKEHLASNAVRDALVQLEPELYHKPCNGKVAVLASYEEDQHDFALRCINQYLACEGWRSLFLGANTPVSSLIFSLNRYRPSLVVVSVSLSEQAGGAVIRLNEEVIPAARKVGAKVAVGGAGICSPCCSTVHADFVADSVLDFERIAETTLYEKLPVND